MLAMGLSLLPLSALLLAYPAVNSQESVLSDVVDRRRSVLRRLFALISGVAVLLSLLAFSVEITSRLMSAGVLPAKGQFGEMASGILNKFDVARNTVYMGKFVSEEDMTEEEKETFAATKKVTPLAVLLPPALVQHWPVVVLLIYLGDLLLLLAIGRVPISYNLRNLIVRWKLAGMTLFAFTFVIALLVFMLGFVNGMNNLTENTGVPGNVFVLSEGATDELFSNLGYGDVSNIERASTSLDKKNQPLPRTVKVMSFDDGGQRKYLSSRETYYVINMPIPESSPPRRRFVQLRTLEDPAIAGMVHNMALESGPLVNEFLGSQDGKILCVLGAGIAATLGADQNKKRLEPGDEFNMGDMTWRVVGIMKSEGTTFGSEVWALKSNLITKPFGKESHTTLIMRVDVEGNRETQKAASQALAYELSKRYTQQKLKAISEPDYYAELTKANNQFLSAIIILAVVMSVGGVFAMMIAMFASIAQRKRDIGVLRLLGYKRWQVLVSFMLESLTMAVVGGTAGVLLGWLVGDGKSATSTLSSGGGGGGKNFAVRIDIDTQIMMAGLLLALVMGRLGGLVPALSAMRIKILDALR